MTSTQARVGAKRQVSVTRRRWPVVLAFLAPALVLYIVFVLVPVVQGIRFSGYAWNGLGPLTDWVGLDNFRRALADSTFRSAMWHNIVIIVLSLALQLPFAFGLAVLLNQRLRGRAVLRTFFFAPYVLAEVITAVVWKQMLQPGSLVDAVFNGLGLENYRQLWLADPDFVLYTVFFVVTWKYFGFHMILMLAGLQQIPAELTDAAAIDGAGWWQSLRHVTIPLLRPALTVSVFLSVIGSLQLFDLVWVMTKGGPIDASETMATYMIDAAFRSKLFGYANAISVIIFVLSLPVAIIYQRFVVRGGLEQERALT